MEHGLRQVEVYVKGPGSGREAAIRSLQSSGLGSEASYEGIIDLVENKAWHFDGNPDSEPLSPRWLNARQLSPSYTGATSWHILRMEKQHTDLLPKKDTTL